MSSDSTTSVPTTTTLAPALDYLNNYLLSTVGGQQSLPPIWWISTVFLLASILLCHRYRNHVLMVRKDGFSTPLKILFYNHLLNNSVFIFSTYVINKIVSYNPAIDQAKWLNTWWSFWVGNYLIVSPCAVFFVTLDRFLALKFSYRYGRNFQRVFGHVATWSVLALYAFSLLDVLIAWPYYNACNDSVDNPIANRPCLPLFNKIVNYTQQAINVGLSIANIGIGTAVLWSLWALKLHNVNDRIVRITIICELIFHALPGIVQLVFSIASLNININVYTFFCLSLDSFVCSVVYAKIMFRLFNDGKTGDTTKIAPISTIGDSSRLQQPQQLRQQQPNGNNIVHFKRASQSVVVALPH